jgi:glycosyltransferase involved in cell wall biosynthesis
MKILIGVHQFFPEYRGGTEILALSTAKELQARGFEVSVVAGAPAPKDLPESERFDRYVFEGIPVERFRHAHVKTAGQNIAEAEYNNKFFANWFRELIRELRPDVVHFFHLERLSASAISVCREAGIPTIFTPTDFWAICPAHQLRLPDQSFCQGPDSVGSNCVRHLVSLVPRLEPMRAAVEKLPNWMMQAMVRTIAKQFPLKPDVAESVTAVSKRLSFLSQQIGVVDAILVPNRSMQSSFAENGFDLKNFRLVPYGISQPRGERKKKNDGVLKIGFIGTLSDHKGAHVLIQAARALRDVALEVHIYGAMDQYPEYVARLRVLASGDRRIFFKGTFDNAHIGDVMSSLDVLVVPSLWRENTPLVLYSAQMFKLPVIGSNVEGISEVVQDGQNGLLFPVGDTQALAAAIARIAQDRGLLETFSAAAKKPKTIAEYTDELVGVYSELTSLKRKHHG